MGGGILAIKVALQFRVIQVTKSALACINGDGDETTRGAEASCVAILTWADVTPSQARNKRTVGTIFIFDS